DIEIAFNDADSISDWAQEAVTALAAMGIINGRDTGGFDPQATITRGESASIICKILDLIKGGLNND
ncbi:MAG: S-layer homology domain-containing protein, partial [Clostridiaceae bacterium]|nr:S-layer homology domain-containing protein [Clostridiaceae bacterium]